MTSSNNPTSAPNTPNEQASKIWILVFIFSFLGLLVDGADLLLLSFSLSSLEAEWGLTQFQKGMLGTYTLAGMAIGGIFGGWLADRFGRVKVVVASILVFSIGTAILGATQSYFQFAVMRFVASLGLGALYVACNTLMAEYVPTKYRTTVLGTLQAGWSVGYIVASLLAGWIIPNYGWRWLFYIAIIPSVMAVAMQFIVPEPPAWRAAKAKRDADKAAGIDNSNVKKEGSLSLIFANKATRNMFLLWAATAGFLQFGYYGVNNWMPNYLEKELGMAFKSMTFFLVGSYTAMILGKILAGIAADYFGRRAVYAFGAIGTAAFLPIIVFFNSPGNIIYLMVAFGFLYGIPYGVNATYMTESFETKIRGSAVGGAYNVGRAGAAIAPACIGFIATHYSIGAGFLVMGAAYFMCGLIPALFIKDKLFDPQK
ncbi:MFS transporter [Entomomonas asaccharolytica]|uniref:MFS transporter n=1 Tax=Entomomonas asaccharolytica TaxID=2785331 RepID=A0A974RZ73_9GAMM|nr:MFS transporter [Entomomonas asaccharolytica]QQP86749.1 MFS transporter [Entomomonas asaccharolytica]